MNSDTPRRFAPPLSRGDPDFGFRWFESPLERGARQGGVCFIVTTEGYVA
jgi:hypothetical protein